MATPVSHPRVIGLAEDENLDSIGRLLAAFVTFTGHPLSTKTIAALRAMVEAVVDEETVRRLESNATHVDAVRLAETLYRHIEDAHAKEIALMLNEAGLDSEALDEWTSNQSILERRRR